MKTHRLHPDTPKRKAMLIKSISIMLPVLLLAMAEALLRIGRYGYNTDVFIESPQNNAFLMFNPQASRKYFTSADLTPQANTELFKKEKDANTLRIFVLGESTTQGYPYLHNGSFHRWLQHRLMNTFPNKKFEIVNLALTAVNSYTVLGFAKDLARHKPDAVLIYTGHNEYYGTLGVAATENIGNSRFLINLVLTLRRLRLVQWLTNTYEALCKPGTSNTRTRMKMTTAQKTIPYGSALYNSGLEQFRANMDETLRTFHTHGIPVFISTLVSNIRNMKPFQTETADSTQHTTFHKQYSLGIEALAKGDSSQARHFFQQANIDYNKHALCRYYLGQLALHTGNEASAKEHLSMARDLDPLRFRAPSAFNDIILELCRKYPNAHAVNTAAAFEHQSYKKIIGNDLMLEHVHPNLMGYAILSDVFYEALKAQKVFTLVYEPEMTFSQLLASMPITIVDSLAGLTRVSMLKHSWPFTETPRQDTRMNNTPEGTLAQQLAAKKIGWSQAMDSLYHLYTTWHALKKAEKVVESMILEHPTEQAYYERAAMLSGQLGDHARAVTLFEKAFDLNPSFEQARYLFVLYLKLDKPFESLPYINYGIKHNRSAFNLERLKAQVEEVIGMKETLKADSLNTTVINHIAGAYLKMDNLDGAHKYVNKVLRIDAGNKEARLLSAYIIHKQSNL